MKKSYTNTKIGKTVEMYVWEGEIKHLKKMLDWLTFDKLIIFSDTNVILHHGEVIFSQLWNLRYHTVLISPWESNKTKDVFFEKSEEILSLWISSKTIMIIFWWGVVWNLWWLIASTILRWIRFIHVPTTLLAQSDSCMGGKQWINTWYWKNTIGAIAEPEFIIVDYDFLNTLPKRELMNGISESIKHSMIQDMEFYTWFSSNDWLSVTHSDVLYIAEKTMNLKLQIMDMGKKINGVGILMKYGHEIWHALEGVSNKYLHWEWVSIGICFTIFLETKLWIKPIIDFERTKKLFKQWLLPVVWAAADKESLLKQLRKELVLTEKWIDLIHLNTYWECSSFTKDNSKIHLTETEFINYFNEYA